MNALGKRGWLPRRYGTVAVLAGIVGMIQGGRAAEEGGATPGPGRELLALGGELFQREWMAGDARSPGGDGLGPLYNDTSCVACHNLGAPGGAGPANKNIVLLTATLSQPARPAAAAGPPLPLRIPPESEQAPAVKAMYAYVQAENVRRAAASKPDQLPPSSRAAAAEAPPPRPITTPKTAPAINPPEVEASDGLAEIHPGFRTSRSVALHRFGTDPGYESWRRSKERLGLLDQPTASENLAIRRPPGIPDLPLEMRLLQADMRRNITSILTTPRRTRVGTSVVLLLPSERNTTALFGAGRIEAIPDREIEAAAAEQAGATPSSEIHGRVCRLKDGRIGRFGWKAQMASLGNFVRNACAIELGLEVPGHPQAIDPRDPEARAKGFDLTDRECDALTAYVVSLPAPVERAPAGDQEAIRIARGRGLLATIGCATCHRPALGDVAGIYSDLLLHDMGPGLAASGAYGVDIPDSPEEVQPDHLPAVAHAGRGAIVGATRQEWRTPPLWGLRDSGPYLHDGRAATLEQAIAGHGGEAERAARRFFALAPDERAQLTTFLKALVAPAPQLARNEAR